jgi:hypothetical protein
MDLRELEDSAGDRLLQSRMMLLVSGHY